jgi:hypothetical protein
MAPGLFTRFLEVPGLQGLGNSVFFSEPFAEVNQFAALGAKRSVTTLEPFPHPFAGRTFYVEDVFHLR